MHKRLEKKWLRLEETKVYYDDILSAYNQTQLQFKPDEQSWSMMEVVQHLYTSEKLSIDFVKKFDFNRKSLKLGIKAKVYTALLVNRMNSRQKFKAPKVLSENKDIFNLENDVHSFSELWNALRHELKLVLDNFPDDKLDFFTFNHPATGKMTIGQMLSALNAHRKHHQHQIERITRHPNFPDL